MQQLNLFGGYDEVAKSPIDILKSRPSPDPRSPVVVSYGGGRNSTALLILCQKLGIRVDLILFADTGGEKQETYEYIRIFDKWLTSNGMPPIITVRKNAGGVSSTRKTWVSAKDNFYFGLKSEADAMTIKWLLWWVSVTGHKFETLEENCLASQTLPSKAYGRSSCSIMWKVEPQDNYVDNWSIAKQAWSTGVLVRKLIGYHSKEPQRLIDKKTKQMRNLEDKKYRYEYPLIHYGLDDFACMQLIASVGLPVPPKSSCFFCPSSKISDIQNLDPELKARACLIEQCAESGVHWQDSSVKGLGRKFKWRDIGKLTELEKAALEFNQESRRCHCMD